MASYVVPSDAGWEYNGNQSEQYGRNGDDVLAPNSDSKSYMLSGGNGDDTLIGQSYHDDLYGGNGRDWLYGDYGNDYLYGGRHADAFIFDTELNKKQNVDFIGDFNSKEGDEIWLSKSVFSGIGDKNKYLASKKFEVNDEATSSNTRILFNKDKGALYYTKKGDDGSQVKFATLQKGIKLDDDDFYVIA